MLLVMGLSSFPRVLMMALLRSLSPPWTIFLLVKLAGALGASVKDSYGRGLPWAGLTEPARCDDEEVEGCDDAGLSESVRAAVEAWRGLVDDKYASIVDVAVSPAMLASMGRQPRGGRSARGQLGRVVERSTKRAQFLYLAYLLILLQIEGPDLMTLFSP